MVKEQKENCAIERLDREPLIELNLFIQLIYYTKVTLYSIENFVQCSCNCGRAG
jgi:hypothetical protein